MAGVENRFERDYFKDLREYVALNDLLSTAALLHCNFSPHNLPNI